MTQQAGKLITVEGIEGVGKTTNLRFMVEWMHNHSQPVLATREPGGTPLADDIRHFLLADHNEIICPDAELLLMFAARAQHLARVILPALHSGKWVICDRFTDASYAYQGAGRGLPMSKIATLETLVQGELRPDLTILLDAPLEVALERIKQRGKLDRFESEEISFFERVRNNYLERASREPHRFRVVSTHQNEEIVQSKIVAILEEFVAVHAN